jgi:hypothetical protein
MNAAHTPTPRTDAERLKREIDSYQKEIPDCIQSAKDAHLQNWEQLSIIGVLRRFPQICHWYKTSERELAEARESESSEARWAEQYKQERDALAVALRELMFDCLRFRIEPSDDAYKNAESALATLEGRAE